MKHTNSLKRIGTVALSVLLLLAFATTAYAAESTATFRGRTSLFGYVPDDGSATGLFNNLQGLMPGGTYTQKITVDNTSGSRVDIYLRGEQIQRPASRQAGYAYDLLDLITFKLKDGSTILAEGKLSDIWPETGGTNTGDGRFIRLGRFYRGDYKVLMLELTVPEELNNDYQDATGKVRWVFQADVYTRDDDDDDDDDDDIPLGPPVIIINDGEQIPLAPGTGDDANIYLWGGLFVIFAVLLAVLLVHKRGRKA